MKIAPKSLGLALTGILVPTLAARAARSLAGVGYRSIADSDPPKNPAHPTVSWKEAIVWTACSALVGGMARLAVRRWLADTPIPAQGVDRISLEDAVD